MPSTAVYTSSFWFIGFLIVFRTTEAASRFNSGISGAYSMTSDFLNSASFIISLSRASQKDDATLAEFRGTVVRLFSILNLACLNHLGHWKLTTLLSWKGCLIDAAGIDETTYCVIESAGLSMPEATF